MIKYGYLSLNSNYLLKENSLKNLFFLFDTIYFDKHEYEQSREFITIGKHMAPRVRNEFGEKIVGIINGNISDIEYLIDKKLLVEVNPIQIEDKFINANPESNYTKFFKEFSDKANLYYFQAGSIIASIASLSVFLQKEIYNPNFENNRSVILSDIIGLTENKQLTPIFNPTGFKVTDYANFSKERSILEIVISKFPVTNFSNVAWEKIIDFKADTETQTNILRLKNCMIDVSKSDLSHYEIQEKLDYLLNEYIVHLKRHKLHFQYSVLKEVLITTAEIAENIIRLKFSQAINSVLNIGTAKMKLMDIKENAPGKEVAIFHQLTTLKN